MLDKPHGEDWVAVSDEALPVADALAWAVVPGCGGLVSFVGTVRDFSDGRDEVTSLEYEAYPELVVPRLAELARSARAAWSEIGRIVLLHRVGRLEVEQAAVVVCASTPHRAQAFDVAEYLIDTLKGTIPIWKRETWSGGNEWSEGTCDISEVPKLDGHGGFAPSRAEGAHLHSHAGVGDATQLDAAQLHDAPRPSGSAT